MKHILGIYISGKLWRKIHLDDYPDFKKGQIITIGRRETCDICIPKGTISREHAHVKFDGKHVRIIDNGSLNGIYLSGRKRNQIVLENGMQVRIGPECDENVVMMYVEVGSGKEETEKGKSAGATPKKSAKSTGLSPWEISTSGTVCRRLFAAIIDWMVIMFMVLGYVGVVVLIMGGLHGAAKLFLVTGVPGIAFLYFTVLESDTAGKTWGKRALSVAVTDKEGNIIGLGRAALRTAGKMVSAFTLFLPVFGNRRCLHDLIAGTKVIKSRGKNK